MRDARRREILHSMAGRAVVAMAACAGGGFGGLGDKFALTARRKASTNGLGFLAEGSELGDSICRVEDEVLDSSRMLEKSRLNLRAESRLLASRTARDHIKSHDASDNGMKLLSTCHL